MGQKFTQGPDEILDYSLDVTPLMVDGDSLVFVNFTLDSGLSLLSQNFDNEIDLWWNNLTGRSVTTCWVYGGNVGFTYNVTCLFSTAQGRTYERTFQLAIKSK